MTASIGMDVARVSPHCRSHCWVYRSHPEGQRTMTKLNWSRAKQSTYAHVDHQRLKYPRALGQGISKSPHPRPEPSPAEQAWDNATRTRDIAPPPRPHISAPWPRYVTTGPLTKNGLTVHTFNTPAEAIAAGFAWVAAD